MIENGNNSSIRFNGEKPKVVSFALSLVQEGLLSSHRAAEAAVLLDINGGLDENIREELVKELKRTDEIRNGSNGNGK